MLISIAAIAGLSVLPGSLNRLHPVGHGGGGILVPAGDDHGGSG